MAAMGTGLLKILDNLKVQPVPTDKAQQAAMAALLTLTTFLIFTVILSRHQDFRGKGKKTTKALRLRWEAILRRRLRPQLLTPPPR